MPDEWWVVEFEPMQLPALMFRERKKRGMKQAQVARIVGTDQGTYSNYELGVRAFPETAIKRLAQHYGLDEKALSYMRYEDELRRAESEDREPVPGPSIAVGPAEDVDLRELIEAARRINRANVPQAVAFLKKLGE